MSARTPVAIVFLLLVAGAIIPPFVPLAGPLSVDDFLPLVAVMIAIAVASFSRRPLEIDATALGFVLLALVALISSAANAESLSDFGRLAGRSAGRAVFYAALIIGARTLLDREDWPRRAVMFVIAAATVESLFCIWAYETRYFGPWGSGVVKFAQWSVLEGRVRVQGTFGGARGQYEAAAVAPNFLAAYLVMTIPVTAGWVLSSKNRAMAVVGALAGLAQLATLYLTYTRAALVALGIGILGMGFLLGKKRLAIGTLVVGAVVALSVPTVRTKFLSEGHDRWALFWASAAITADNPVTGVGDGNYERTLHENQHYHDTPYGIATTTSHNSVLLSAAHYGVGGGAAHLVLYLMLVLVALRAVRQARGPRERLLAAGLAAGLVGFLAQDQLNNLAYVPKVATQMWFLVALLPLVSRGGASAPAAARARRAASVVPMGANTAPRAS